MSENGFKIAYDLISEEYKNLYNEMTKCHELLNKAKVPSNGVEGVGKREELTLSQRIKRLLNDDSKSTL